MSELDSSLPGTIRCYRELREHLLLIDGIWNPERSQDLEDYLLRLDRLQQAVRSADRRLFAALQSAPERTETRWLAELRTLMADVVQRTHSALPRLTALKDLVAAELRQVRSNRSAIGGYQSGRQSRGGVVSSTI